MQEQSSTTNQNHLASQFRVSRCPQPGSVARARSCKDLEHTAVEEAGNPKKPHNPNCQVISAQTESMQCHTAVEQGDHTLNLQTNTLLAASKKSKVHQKVIKSSSKVHQKFIKISQITISGSKISKVHQKFINSSSKVHQKCNAARVKLHLLETVFN